MATRLSRPGLWPVAGRIFYWLSTNRLLLGHWLKLNNADLRTAMERETPPPLACGDLP